jgi:hypothetical protein
LRDGDELDAFIGELPDVLAKQQAHRRSLRDCRQESFLTIIIKGTTK